MYEKKNYKATQAACNNIDGKAVFFAKNKKN